MSAKSSFCCLADLRNLTEIRQFVESSATALAVEPAAIPDLVLAVDEAATNIIVHGYRDQGGEIEIEIDRKRDTLYICLRDQAAPFDPTQAPAPNLELPLEERLPGGLGIYLIRRIMDRVTHRLRPGGGNELILAKKLQRK